MTMMFVAQPVLSPFRRRRPVRTDTAAEETGRELVTQSLVATPPQTGEDVIRNNPPSFLDAVGRLLVDLVREDELDAQDLGALNNALLATLRLVDDLSGLIGVPEVDVDPDGDIAVDWYLLNGSRLAASVAPSGRVAFALLTREAGTVKGASPSVSRAGAAMKSALADYGITNS